jgi:hypothetical protein
LFVFFIVVTKENKMNARKFLNIALSMLVLLSLIFAGAAPASAQDNAAPQAGVR